MGLSGPAVVFLGVIGLIWVGLYLVGLGRRWGVLVPFGLMPLIWPLFCEEKPVV